MNSLKEYSELFVKLGLSELSVEEDGHKIHMKKEPAPLQNPDSLLKVLQEAAPVPMLQNGLQVAGLSAADAQGMQTKGNPQGLAPKGRAITAPLLGIFYPMEGEKGPVSVGDMVQKGDVLCNIEAMKMMNEVKAPFSGKVIEVCAQEGDLVEFDQNLFVVEE